MWLSHDGVAEGLVNMRTEDAPFLPLGEAGCLKEGLTGQLWVREDRPKSS